MDAESREAVFAALRQQGIKAIKVVAADGSKANGEIRGIRKRVLAASVIATALLAGIAVYFLNSRILRRDNFGQTGFVTSQTRRQVIGDAAIIEKGIRTGWADVFELEGERFLASFAIPGVPAGQRSTTVEEIQKALDAPWREVSDTPRQLPSNWRKVSDTPRQLLPSDSLEVRHIRAMVEDRETGLTSFPDF